MYGQEVADFDIQESRSVECDLVKVALDSPAFLFLHKFNGDKNEQKELI
jgi:hypothetical protein